MYTRVNPGLIAVPDWQSGALPFTADAVLAEAVTHRTAMQSGETSNSIGRLRFLAENTALFIVENAAMPRALSLAAIRLGHFSILNLTAPALILEGFQIALYPGYLFSTVRVS